jgi:hypothetical protein
VTFGFTASLEEILRYGLIQTHTPDAYLGRVNSLWSAQETAGYAAGSLGAGLAGRALGPGSAIMAYGIASALLATALTAVLPGLRRAAFPPLGPAPLTGLVDGCLDLQDRDPESVDQDLVGAVGRPDRGRCPDCAICGPRSICRDASICDATNERAGAWTATQCPHVDLGEFMSWQRHKLT